MARFTARSPLLELTAAGRPAARRSIVNELEGNATEAAARPPAPRNVRRETGKGIEKILHSAGWGAGGASGI